MRIAHFGGEVEDGVIVARLEEGRRLRVRGAAGELREFVLSAASAQFVSASDPHGPRLELFSP